MTAGIAGAVARAVRGTRRRMPETVLLAVLGCACALFVHQSASLLAWRYEAEPWEATEFIASRRIAAGETCYGWPRSAAYPPRFYCYPPLFAALGACAHRTLDALAVPGARGLWVHRMLALCCTAAVGVLVYRIVRRRTGRRCPALAAALFFLAIEPVHRYLNIARPDVCGLLLAIASLQALGSASVRGRAAFVPLAACAILCKQYIVVLPLAGLWYAAGRSRREAAVLGACLGGTLAAAGLALHLATHGDAFRNVISYQSLVTSDTVFGAHNGARSMISLFSRLLGWSLVPQIVAIGYTVRHWGDRFAAGGQWMLAYAVATPLGIASTFHWGAYTNRLLPASALCTIVFALGLAELLRDRDRQIAGAARRLGAVCLLAAIHPIIYAAPVERVDMSDACRREHEAVSRYCADARGPVLCEMASMAALTARPDVVTDLVAMKPALGPAARLQQAHLRDDLRARRYALVLLYTRWRQGRAFLDRGAYDALLQAYTRVASLPRAGFDVYQPARR